jgi:hypothetical protein
MISALALLWLKGEFIVNLRRIMKELGESGTFFRGSVRQ